MPESRSQEICGFLNRNDLRIQTKGPVQDGYAPSTWEQYSFEETSRLASGSRSASWMVAVAIFRTEGPAISFAIRRDLGIEIPLLARTMVTLPGERYPPGIFREDHNREGTDVVIEAGNTVEAYLSYWRRGRGDTEHSAAV